MICLDKNSWKVTGQLALMILVVVLAGCAKGSNVADLQEYVSEIKSRKGSIVDLPEFKSVEGYVYHEKDLKDPFVSWEQEVIPFAVDKNENRAGLHPDAKRSREPLEAFPLDTLRMVGTLLSKGNKWALVQTSNGVVYRVREANYIGQNHGRIIGIDDNKINIVEIVSNGLGGWEERRISLTMVSAK